MEEEEQLSDDALMIELINKDKNNFYLLTNAYKDKLERYIKRISFFAQAEVEDILQEVFIKVYINLNSFDKSLKFSSWIYRIAHNLVIDKIRKNSKRTRDVSIDDEYLSLIIKSDEDLHVDLVNRESVEKLKNVIFGLSDSYREVLILRFIEEKSYEEICDILKKPKGTIAALINKGRKIIKEKLVL